MLKLKKIEGIWHVHGTVAGRRIRKSTRTGDRQVAQRELRKLERDAWAERHNPHAETVAFEAAALAYMEAGGERRFIIPLLEHFKGVDIASIKPGHIQDAARALYPKASNATWNRNAVTPCRAILNFGVERGWCSPIKIKSFPEERKQRAAASRDWLDAFMEAAEPELATLALFMFTTGARVSDALQITRLEDRYVWMDTKTGERKAIMSRELMLRMKGPFRWRHRWSIYKPWKRACAAAGIEYLPPHQAGRHAFATELIVRKGVDPMTTRDLGGWKSTRMLERYAHPEALDGVVDAVFGKSVTSQKKVVDNKRKK